VLRLVWSFIIYKKLYHFISVFNMVVGVEQYGRYYRRPKILFRARFGLRTQQLM
jgi:hypothetical protein